MEDIDFIFNKPNFSSWPISTSLQSLLLREEKWPEYFAIGPTALAPVLNTISEQIKPVNFFNHPPETDLFFRFLRKFVESKPHNDDVLKAFSQITAEILDKLSLEARFDSQQENVVIHYLNLLALMLEPRYRYLFDKAEISIWTNDFQKISRTPFYSNALLSHFRNTLLLSFQCVPFIKNYPALIQTLNDLAYSLEKVKIDSNELAFMKLLDTLGVLDHTLKTSPIWRIKKNQTVIQQLIRETHHGVYNQFKWFVEERFLKYIFYKSYLQQSNKDMPVTTLMQLCESRDYQEQCNVHSALFNTSYDCPPGQFSDLFITIRLNDPQLKSANLCKHMRGVEPIFMHEMKKFEIDKLNYTGSQNYLYITDSKKDYLTATFLFERDDPPEASYTVWATYFPAENQSLSDPLLGSTYTYTMNPSILKHEYIHHLTALFVKNISLDLTLTEGIAELYAEGICSKRQINDLRNFVNDTFIFEFFKARRYPFYFNALKWTGYLTNENPELFKILVNYWQKNDLESFYTNINSFITNTSNVETFVDWSRQHVNTCNHYLNIFPDGQQPPLIYLDDVKTCLNQMLPIEFSNHSLPNGPFNRNLLSDLDDNLDEIALAYYSADTKPANQEFSSQVKVGLPLPLYSLSAGFTSACMDDVGLANKDKYPYLPAYIQYGIKPFMFAALSAGLNSILFDEKTELEEKFARLFIYSLLNYLSLLIGQPLTQMLAKTTQNKIICFFVQSLAWMMLWNPSLFISESSRILPTLFLQLSQGLCFKVGEETYHLGKKAYSYSSSFWHKQKPPSLATGDGFLNNDEEMQMGKIGQFKR